MRPAIIVVTRKGNHFVSNHATMYRLSESERNQRIQEFTDVSDPEDLRAELGAARYLAHQALEEGNVALSNAILNTIAKLSQSQVAVKRMRDQYLERGTVLRIVTEVVQILTRAVENKFPGWESVLDQAADEVVAVVAATKNENPRLKGPKQ
ncbi:MAG: hypothetical protein ABFC77_05440 [Thermoguttaceae bacterium]